MLDFKKNWDIYPTIRNPYYFVAPRYIRTSAGIKAIYLLCHWLNRVGESAFIYTWPANIEGTINVNLLTPIVTQAIIDQHRDQGLAPIFVYADTASENVANADVVVRYFGHYPGHLAPYVAMSDDELHFSHSAQIAEKTNAPGNVIYVPVCDRSIFHPPATSTQRKGTCFYAAKYKNFFGGQVFGLPENCIEITRDCKTDFTPHQLGELFRKSEMLYLFEDSAIGNEATMCGCPVVLVPNAYFKEPVGFNEVGRDGIALGLDAAEIERAKNTVGFSYNNYMKLIDAFPAMLDLFITKTQAFSLGKRQTRRLLAPEENYYKLLESQFSSSNELQINPNKGLLKRRFESVPFIGPHLRRVRTLREKQRRLEQSVIELQLRYDYLKRLR